VGSIARMSKFPEHHVSELRKISGLLKTANNDVRGLLETTDATDGFDVEERTNFQKLGIQQQRKDNLRQKYLDIDTKLNEEIVNGARKSIATGHSISPVIVQVENVIKQITPKTKSEILDEFKSSFPPNKPISRDDYSKFAMNLIDDMSEVPYIQANWISISDEDIYDKAGLN
jgi:hypothetical protein